MPWLNREIPNVVLYIFDSLRSTLAILDHVLMVLNFIQPVKFFTIEIRPILALLFWYCSTKIFFAPL